MCPEKADSKYTGEKSCARTSDIPFSERRPELSIVMPCLNEEETLEICLRKARRFLERSQVHGEILVADNGSTDSSIEIAQRLEARVIKVPLKGYGAALYHGITAAKGIYIVMGDADDSYNFDEIGPLLEALREGNDLVMGNRFAGGIRPGAMPWKNKWIGNPLLSGIGRLVFGCPSKDFHCGLRGFRKSAFDSWDLRTTGMEFASEMVIKASLHKARISEVPVTLYPDGRSRPPHLKPWRDGWRHLRFMLLHSPRWLFFYPGTALLILGSLLTVRLLFGPIWFGSIGFDVHSMLFGVALILIGFQTVAFAIVSKVFAVAHGLLPGNAIVRFFSSSKALEAGLICGGTLFAVGITFAIQALLVWSNKDFSSLDPSQVMRLVVPSVLLLCLGTQFVFSSFLVGVLAMRERELPRNPKIDELKTSSEFAIGKSA